jgi:hypothetical protein
MACYSDSFTFTFTFLSLHLYVMTAENHEELRMAGIWEKAQTGHIMNTSHGYHRLSQTFLFCLFYKSTLIRKCHYKTKEASQLGGVQIQFTG